MLGYDVLIVATGARLVPEETQGMAGDGSLETVFPFYTPEGRPPWPGRWSASTAVAWS